MTLTAKGLAPITRVDISLSSAFLRTSEYVDLPTLITAVSTTPTLVLVDSVVTITADATIPATVSLWFLEPGQFSIASTKTVTIVGSITSTPRQIFTGLGTVSLAGNLIVSEVWAEWWGAKGDNLTGSATANATAFNAASNALITNGTYGSGEVRLGPGNYYFNTTWTIGHDAQFSGISVGGSNSLVGTNLIWYGATNTKAIYINKGRSNHLHDFQLINGVALGTTVGLFMGGPGATGGTMVSGVHVDRVTISGFYHGFDCGTDGNAASEIYFHDCTFTNCTDGAYTTGFNSLDFNFLNCSWVFNTGYGINAAVGNVVVINGSAGVNGCDFRSQNSLPFLVMGLRTESTRVFEGQGTAAHAAANFINVSQNVNWDFIVSGATNASPIEITTTANHGFTTGDQVFITGVLGNTAANGWWTAITVTAVNKFTLDSSTGSGAYTSGGTGLKNWKPIVANSHSLILDGCVLAAGTVSGEKDLIIRNSSGKAPFPIAGPPSGNIGQDFVIENWRQVDGSNVTINRISAVGKTIVNAPIKIATQEMLLNTVRAVDMNTATPTLLFTVPPERTCIVTKVVVYQMSGNATTASYSFGWNSAAFNDVIADATHTELTGSTLSTALSAMAGAKIGVAGDTFKVKMNTLQGSSMESNMQVYGYYGS